MPLTVDQINNSADSTVIVITATGKIITALIGLFWLAYNTWQLKKSEYLARANSARLDKHGIQLDDIRTALPPKTIEVIEAPSECEPVQHAAPLLTREKEQKV